MLRALRSLLICSFVLSAAALVHSQIIEIEPGDLATTAAVETFETLTTAPPFVCPIGYEFPSGLVFEGEYCNLVDFSLTPTATFACGTGWGPPLDAASIIPSGTAVMVNPTLFTMEYTLPSPSQAVGFYFDCSGGAQATLEAFDAGGQSLGTATVSSDGLLDGALDGWVGVAMSDGSSSIASISITGIFAIDDLAFGAVEILPSFARGDCNGDDAFDVSDAISALASLFIAGTEAPPCLDACDTDDSGAFDIGDAVTMLGALFVSSALAPAPPTHPDCGLDPTPDGLGCAAPLPSCW